MQTELKVTEDGSHTLFVPEIDECYHSTHGAIQESQHIFIEAGLKQCPKPEIRVLEIGFGTGLNAFLTFLEAGRSGKQVHYTSLERYPVSVEKALQLNYPEELVPGERRAFEQMHVSAWNAPVQVNDYFSLEKIETDFTRFDFTGMYDVIYFDAFSPEKQPEMWSRELFEKIYTHCYPGAILTTYCAKGMVRRVMQAAGFTVERLPGPPGKREILRGIKSR
ncbi:MAG: tRNA (5-methylaminomethyl-2-thiouridine)(34)-methyltransferase MnmD [Bacteroidota bacterium]|nr:tRNA (5-methylaminomethyl-2-thiouridine)(34)-methyltransferase MnmD [Bacteroidota bacterium]